MSNDGSGSPEEDEMKIRKFKINDSKEAGNLIGKTFKMYNNKEGTKKGIQNYIDFYSSRNHFDEMQKSFIKSKIFYILEDKGKIVGLIRGNSGRIINLFLDKKYHRKGLGKKLLEKFEEESFRHSKIIKVNSSLYAIQFYQKNGYKKTTGIKNSKKMKGIKYQPMKK